MQMTTKLTLEIIRALSVAHTDAGDFFIYDGELTREFNIEGTVLRKRAGFLSIKIGEEKFSFSSSLSAMVGDCIQCLIRAEPSLQSNEQKGLESSTAKFIIQSVSLCK